MPAVHNHQSRSWDRLRNVPIGGSAWCWSHCWRPAAPRRRGSPLPTPQQSIGLLGLIGERLEVAPDVARVKWNTNAPIEDVSRERAIIEGVARRGAEYGLDSAIAGSFFLGQIEASKTVQTALHAEWRASRQPPFANVRDLDQDIRPMLDRLTPMMLRALVDALPVIQRQGGRELLDTRNKAVLAESPGGTTAVRQAVAPLRLLSR
jgi:chorismate mutase